MYLLDQMFQKVWQVLLGKMDRRLWGRERTPHLKAKGCCLPGVRPKIQAKKLLGSLAPDPQGDIGQSEVLSS